MHPDTDSIRANELEDLKSLLKSETGRRFCWKIMEQAHVFSSSFDRDNQHATAFREGERNMGLMLLADIMEACPDRYLQMQREAKIRQEQKDNERRDSDE